ncbi:MAG TPA: PAAR domain-containing protein [Reyranella sp.]|nr:PAAR domain-containing protein [Reyranella sp.]
MPAARLGDMHVCPMVTVLVPHVGGPIAGPGCPTVLIGGMPAAQLGSMCAHGGAVVVGCPTVLIS